MVLSLDRWKNKLAVVTGGGGGIGSATVLKLLESGLIVAAVDNSQERLQDLKEKSQNKKNLHTFCLDITVDEDVQNFYKKITQDLGPVHVLANIAGVCYQDASLLDGDSQKWLATLKVNVLALCIMTREAIKVMRHHQVAGHIIHICSVAGHVVPLVAINFNVYAASKHAVRSLMETLRLEMIQNGVNIKLTNLSPGLVNTKIFDNNGIDMENLKALSSFPSIEPEDIADAILYVLSTPPHVLVHELMVRPMNEAL